MASTRERPHGRLATRGNTRRLHGDDFGGAPMPEKPGNGNEDIKAKMREALDRKQAHDHPDDSAGSKDKAHGPEVVVGAPKMHRRKAGGGGS